MTNSKSRFREGVDETSCIRKANDARKEEDIIDIYSRGDVESCVVLSLCALKMYTNHILRLRMATCDSRFSLRNLQNRISFTIHNSCQGSAVFKKKKYENRK